MPLTTIPATTGTETWQLISSSTPTSGSTVNFNSVSGYKKLRLVIKGLTLTAVAIVQVRLNDDSGANYDLGASNAASAIIAANQWSVGSATGSFAIADLTFSTADQPVPQAATGLWTSDGGSAGRVGLHAVYRPAGAITAVNVVLSTSSFGSGNTGTIALYGVPA